MIPEQPPRAAGAEPVRPQSKRRAGLLTFGLFLGCVTLTLVATEAGFRLAHVSVGTVQINRGTIRRCANPTLGFELRPSSRVQAEVEYRINAEGMRSPEVSRELVAGRKRVAVLGDSIAFGYWVEEQDAFPRRLEALLRQAGISVDVLNFGVPGYNLEQSVEALRSKALAFSPDTVVIALCLNDLESIFSYEYGLTMDRARQAETWMGRISDRLHGASTFLAWIEYRRAGLEARRTWAKMKNPIRGQLYKESLERQRERLVRSFGEIAALLGPRDVPALVAIFPTFGHRFKKYPHGRLHRMIVSAAEESGLSAVDLLPCFGAYKYWDVRVDVLHPSPLGHMVGAHAIAQALLTSGIFHEEGSLSGRCTTYHGDDFPTVRGY